MAEEKELAKVKFQFDPKNRYGTMISVDGKTLLVSSYAIAKHKDKNESVLVLEIPLKFVDFSLLQK